MGERGRGEADHRGAGEVARRHALPSIRHPEVLARRASLEGWPQTPSLLPSFETPAARARQDEVSAMTASLRRVGAMIVKEFVQLRRDRITFATMIAIPLMQLVLFGYAINTTPRNMPTAVLLQETSDVGRTILAAIERTGYFKITHRLSSVEEFDRVLASGEVLFAIEIPAGFERALRRGDMPALLVAADATDPVGSSSALGALNRIAQVALINERMLPDQTQPLFEIRAHARYNPAASSSLNIVPGLVGTILTMTMLIFTALSVTREVERGTMESLLSMPISPLEIMVGKIIPYIMVGFTQAALIIGFGVLLFGVPILGSLLLLALLSTLFIATNLSIGYSFSTVAQNQLQAIQMTFMFFLPNILLSGFMFPFAGMPVWAQWVGEALPLTHYLRIVRSIMLKGSGFIDLQYEVLALFVLMLVAMTIAVTRFRRTLD
jgi:ABC-2 type transport system permease protein